MKLRSKNGVAGEKRWRIRRKVRIDKTLVRIDRICGYVFRGSYLELRSIRVLTLAR